MAMKQGELAKDLGITVTDRAQDICNVTVINRRNIAKALQDYAAATYEPGILDDITDDFIDTLAHDSAKAKADLRAILRRVKGWDEQLQAVVINGTRTHEPNYAIIFDIAGKICAEALHKARAPRVTLATEKEIYQAIDFFCVDNEHPDRDVFLGSLNRLAPKAYREGRKLSRVFNDFAKAIGVFDSAAGSEYQRLFAKLADEINSKKIDFKLYLSINPAHFLTMSNPKGDVRGEAMVSCHSLNDTDHFYNSGCAGYARDNVTMVAFTASNPNDAATLNNRKTSRQLFMYQDGVLLQSRMYYTNGNHGGSYGGYTGAHPDSPLYRDLVQRAISEGENATNLWSTCNYRDDSSTLNKFGIKISAHYDFGGYADWEEFYKDTVKISVRKAELENGTAHGFTAGAAGLCVQCGGEVCGSAHYCDNCGGNVCEDCGRHDTDGAWVEGHWGEYWVCIDCLNENYFYCDWCDRYHHVNDGTQLYSGEWICDYCRNEHAFYCDECGEWYLRDADDRFTGYRDGQKVTLCRSCFEDYYRMCEHCGDDYHVNEVHEVENEYGEIVYYCAHCYCEYCKERDAE